MKLVQIFTAMLLCSALVGPANSQGQDKANAEKTAQANKNATTPMCSTIRFTGPVSGEGLWALNYVNQSRDPAALIAVNPLRCSPSGLIQTYACRGLDYLENQRAYVVSWSSSWMQIVTTLDLTSGLKDTMLFINRRNITCLDHVKPSLTPSDNYERFWKTNVSHR